MENENMDSYSKLKLNKIFLNRMQNLLGDEYEDFLNSLTKPEQKAIFVNENKIKIENFINVVDFNIEQVPYEKAGFYIDKKLGKHPLHHAGAIYVQDASAMFTVNSIDFKGDELVLDMCAAPGGKSIQIANRLKTGTLVSNEIVNSRCKILHSNIERMGLKNVIITNDTPKNLAKAYAGTFDICLVDAPCSGEGMFRRGEEYIKPWNENLDAMCATRQLEILNNADVCLKEGGKLIYSTCTYSIKENEGVIKKFLETHDYIMQNINASFSRGIDLPETVRIYPHKNKGEGQFVAVLVKKSNKKFQYANSNLKLKEDKMAKDFLKNYINIENFNLDKAYEFNNEIYYVPNTDLIKKGVCYYSLGVNLGEVNNKIFKPSHFLFSAFGEQFKNKINLNLGDIKIEKYLHGEGLEAVATEGYGVIMISNCPLGGFKISDGKFKNLYPKGLRN